MVLLQISPRKCCLEHSQWLRVFPIVMEVTCRTQQSVLKYYLRYASEARDIPLTSCSVSGYWAWRLSSRTTSQKKSCVAPSLLLVVTCRSLGLHPTRRWKLDCLVFQTQHCFQKKPKLWFAPLTKTNQIQVALALHYKYMEFWSVRVKNVCFSNVKS